MKAKSRKYYLVKLNVFLILSICLFIAGRILWSSGTEFTFILGMLTGYFAVFMFLFQIGGYIIHFKYPRFIENIYSTIVICVLLVIVIFIYVFSAFGIHDASNNEIPIETTDTPTSHEVFLR